MNNENFDASLCQEFVDEAEEHLRELEPNLLFLEQHPDDMQVLNDCFRNMHSIKGAAGYMGFRGISTLAHSLENLFDQVRSGEFRLDARAMDVVFAGVDRLKRLVHDVADKGTENGPVDDILADVDSLLARSVSKGSMEEAGKAAPGHAPSFEAVDEEDEELREIFVQEMKDLFARLTETPQEGEDAPARVAYVLEEMERVLHYVGYEEARSRISAVREEFLRDVSSAPEGWEKAIKEVGRVLEPLVGPLDEAMGRDGKGEALLEEEDPELLGIFLDLCREWAPVLGAVPEKCDEKWILRCQEGIQKIRSAANYMDYPHVVNLMDECAERLTEAITHQGEGGVIDPSAVIAIWQRLKEQFPSLGDIPVGHDAEGSKESVLDPMISAPETASPDAEILDAALDDFFRDITPETESKGPLPTQSSVQPASVPEDAPPSPPVLAKDRSAGPERREGPVSPSLSPDTREKVSHTPVPEAERVHSVRIDLDRVERLLADVSELVVLRASVTRAYEDLKAIHRDLLLSQPGLAKAFKPLKETANRLGEQAVVLGRVVQGLQDEVMRMRMLPVSHLFDRCPRVVRDIAQRLGKKVSLVVTGAETGLDKRIIEQMADPLLHIVRNAVDHGIETPEVRANSGKPETGTVGLSARQEGNSVVIRVSDDGKGLDREGLIRKAVSLGLVSRDVAQGLADEQVWEFMFHPGVSTASDVTEISGRGVGMNVVKRNIDKIGGTIRAVSSPGKGTEIVIRIPLTLAIMQTLLARVGSHVMAVPIASIVETIRLRSEDVSPCEGHELISLRQETIPLIRLGRIFRGTGSPPNPPKFFAVLVEHDGIEAALAVDGLIGRQEIVIKPLADYLTDQPGFSGTTILGDGSIGLVLDIPAVVERARSFVKRRHQLLELDALGVASAKKPEIFQATV
ncbi:MAG: chemotaxis protein CheA [Deltaproteobacteria bacterium]